MELNKGKMLSLIMVKFGISIINVTLAIVLIGEAIYLGYLMI